MSAKKAVKKTTSGTTYAPPSYPYSITPNSLRRFLGLIPGRQLPTKVNGPMLKTWGFGNTNDQSIIRVLRSIGLINDSAEPTESYKKYMDPKVGPATLGQLIKSTYPKVFELVANPTSPNDEDLKRFFLVNSGGSDDTIRYQMETYKVLTSYATFGASDPLEQPEDTQNLVGPQGANPRPRGGEPAVRIDLHIHLPESKTKAEYDSILESIAKHLYGGSL